jgi:hypothetical protein
MYDPARAPGFKNGHNGHDLSGDGGRPSTERHKEHVH